METIENLEEIKDAIYNIDDEPPTSSDFGKLMCTNLGAGEWIKIEFKSGIIDTGYAIILPEMIDEDNPIIHINNPNNDAGIGDAPDVWITLYNLLKNPHVQRIIYLP